jgi:hypothetical protein
MMSKEILLSESLIKQIQLINYDRSKTLLENKKTVIVEQSSWSKTSEGKQVIKFLTDLGHDKFVLQNATSSNNAYNLAAVSAMRKLTEKLLEINYNQTDPYFKVSVLNTKPAGGVQKFSSFDSNLIDKLKKVIDNAETIGTPSGWDGNTNYSQRRNINRTIGSTFILEDFYFNYGKIFNAVKGLNIPNNYLFPDGVYNFFTQYFGGDNVNTIKSSIETQNVTSRPKIQDGDYGPQLVNAERVTNETDWKPIVESLHIILPVTSLVLNLFGGPPGMVVGAALETIDAGLYQFYDEDPYMAGLSLIFALVPLTEIAQIPGFKEVTKQGIEEGLERLLWKQVRKEAISKEEEIFLKETVKSKKVQAEFSQAIVNASLRKVLTENPKGYIDILTWFVEKGMLSFEKFSSIILLILGTAAWDYYASKYIGKCSATFKFSDLLQLIPSESTIPNVIKSIEIQPFTQTKEGCEQLIQRQLAKEKKKLLEEWKRNYQKASIGTLRGLKNKKQIFNTSTPDIFLFEVGVIQSILHQCGFTKKDIILSVKNNKLNFNLANRVKKVVVSTSVGKIVETINNSGNDTFYSKPLKNGVYIVLIYTENNEKPLTKKIIIDGGNSGPYNFSSEGQKFNWGYYDEYTKKCIESFQKYFNLSIDGQVGQDTLTKLIEVVKGEKCGVLKNQSGIEFTKDNQDLINGELINTFLKNAIIEINEKTKFDPENLTPEQQQNLDDLINRSLKISNYKQLEDTLYKVEGEL